MQTFTQSAFLQSLGYAIANSLWQMALLWMAVMMINNFFKLSSTVKYRVGVVAQFSGFVWFLITLFFYYKTSSLALAQAEMLQASSTTFLVAQNADQYQNNTLSFIIRAEQMLPYLSVAYLFLLSFLVIKWIRSYRYTNLIQNNGLKKIDVQWKLFVKKLSAELGIKADVKIYLSEIVTSPLTIGFLKPIILIPVASINHLTVPQLEAIILHEMAHIRRLDYLINLFVSIIELCLFFNPFTQLISKIIKNERENSCDDWVLQYQYQPAMYAEALLRIAYLQSTPSLAMAAAGNKQILLTRIKRMLDQNQRKFNYRQHLLALLLMTGILSSLAWFNPTTKNTAQAKNSSDVSQPAVIEPLAVKVDNPLFNPVFFLSKPLKEEVKKAAKEAEKKYKEAQIAVRDMHIPSITAVAAEKIQSLNESKIKDELIRLQKDLQVQEKELASLKLNTWVNNNVSQFFSDSLVASNKQLNSLFTAQTAAAPILLNMEKIGEDMKKAKDEMLKLSKQGVMKFDEKAFDKQFIETIRMAPVAFTTAAYDKLITRWNESVQVELKRRNQSSKETNETIEKRKPQYAKLAYIDSLRGVTAMRMHGSPGFWTATTAPTPGEEEERTAVRGSYKTTNSVAGNSKAPSAYYGYTTEEATSPRKRAYIEIVGPPEDASLTPKVVSTIPRRQLSSAQGGGASKIAAGQHSKPNAKTIIIDGKSAEISRENLKERKVLRVESF
jgi:beta-lactamase regulating signal transducer with metallopeptidase domain